MQLLRLLDPLPEHEKAKKRKFDRKNRKSNWQGVFACSLFRFDVVSALNNVPAGMTSGWLWEDAADAKKTLKSFFGKGKLKFGVMAEHDEIEKAER